MNKEENCTRTNALRYSFLNSYNYFIYIYILFYLLPVIAYLTSTAPSSKMQHCREEVHFHRQSHEAVR